MIDHSNLRELAESATEGPWEYVPGMGNACALVVGSDNHDHALFSAWDGSADARYVAALSPKVILALLDEVESLRTNHKEQQ